jgi:hypothetical protein
VTRAESGEALLHDVEREEGTAELRALRGVLGRLVDGERRRATTAGRHERAAPRENVLQHARALAGFTKQAFTRQQRVFEEQPRRRRALEAQLVLLALHGEATVLRLHEHQALTALCSTEAGRRDRHREQPREAAVGDVALLASDAQVLAVLGARWCAAPRGRCRRRARSSRTPRCTAPVASAGSQLRVLRQQ